MSRRLQPSTSPVLCLTLLSLGACGGDPSASPAPGPTDPPRLGSAAPDLPPEPSTDALPGGLSGEPLVAPPALSLDTEPVPGAVRLRWDAPPPGTTSLRLFERDDATGGESDLALGLASDSEGVRLPLAAHRVRRHALSWRLERCDADGCLSSTPVGLRGDALDTVHDLAPPVAVSGERFGESVALNANGTLLAVATPVEGRLALVFPGGEVPRFAGPLPRLHAESSPTRAMAVASSATGDTLAVLSGDAAAARAPSVVVLERFGESWIETSRFDAFAPGAALVGREAGRPRIALSADGSRLLAACTGRAACPVVVHERDDIGWRAVATLASADASTEADAATDATDATGANGAGSAADVGDVRDEGDASAAFVPRALATSDALDRVVILGARGDAAPELRVHDDVRGWRAPPALALPWLAASAPLVAALDASGSRLAIGGLDASARSTPDAVLWRYRLDAGADGTTLDAEDSVRLPLPAGPASALELAGDAALATVAFGWHTADDEAALATHVLENGSWRAALALPADAPPLARRPFGRALALDADGATLAVGAPTLPAPGAAPGTTLRAGRVLLMRATGGP